MISLVGCMRVYIYFTVLIEYTSLVPIQLGSINWLPILLFT